jgi:hypothetical protein
MKRLINWMADNDPESMTRIAMSSNNPDLTERISTLLKEREHYELLVLINKGNEFADEFSERDPIAALDYSWKMKNDLLMDYSVQVLVEGNDEKVWEAYELLTESLPESSVACQLLFERLDRSLLKNQYFGEIRARAVEVEDKDSVRIIANLLFEYSRDRGDTQDAFYLAYLCDDFGLMDQMEESMKCENVLGKAQSIVDQVQKIFPFKLPSNLRINDEGNGYGAIRYSKQGGNYANAS